jgi:hypothetical protein
MMADLAQLLLEIMMHRARKMVLQSDAFSRQFVVRAQWLLHQLPPPTAATANLAIVFSAKEQGLELEQLQLRQPQPVILKTVLQQPQARMK